MTRTKMAFNFVKMYGFLFWKSDTTLPYDVYSSKQSQETLWKLIHAN